MYTISSHTHKLQFIKLHHFIVHDMLNTKYIEFNGGAILVVWHELPGLFRGQITSPEYADGRKRENSSVRKYRIIVASRPHVDVPCSLDCKLCLRDDKKNAAFVEHHHHLIWQASLENRVTMCSRIMRKTSLIG